MFNGNASPSLADIAAVTGNGRNNDGMWGGDGWWAIIIFAMIFGWGGFGGNGWGGNGGMGSTASAYTDSAIQRGFDTQAIIGKLDGITNGLCDGFYAQNTAIMNGFQSQMANCCCETREAIQGVNYNMAQNTCALQNTMNSNTRDIIDSQQAGTRAILDYLCQEKISSLQAENNDLRRAASQDRQSALLTTAMSAQTQQIINAVNPAAIPAYVVPNPNAYAYGCGCNTGCSC